MHVNLAIVWQNRLILFALIAVISFGASYFVQSKNADTYSKGGLNIAPPNSYQCQGKLIDGPTLSVYAEGKKNSIRLANILCLQLSAKVSQVAVSWQLDSTDIQNRVKQGQFDLVMGRVHLLESFSTSHLQDYIPIAKYPGYTASLITLGALAPQLNLEYLVEKRIGILKSDKSLSGRNIPIKAIRQAGIDMKELQITEVSSHSELRSKLFNNELDVIASYWDDNDLVKHPKMQHLKLREHTEGSKWYLLSGWNKETYRCDIENALIQSGTESDNPFLRLVYPTEDSCRDQQ